jgi:acyl dehydratase
MRYFEDIAVGEVWHLGRREVGAEEIIAFATQYDPQPFHTDAAAAEKSFFGGLIASGWHINAMVMGLLVDNIKAQELHGLGSPGIDRCRWLAPVRPGDVLSGRVTVMAARRSATRPMGLVTLRTEIFNQLNVKVVQMDGVGMYGLRPAPGSGVVGATGLLGAVT